MKNITYARESPLKVLQGTMEIANQMHTLSKGLEESGTISKIINYYPSYLNYQSEYELKGWKHPANREEALHFIQNRLFPEYDLFHFHFSTSLLLDHSDLKLLSSENKPMIMHHWGSDVRSLTKALQINPYAKAKLTNEASIEQKLELLASDIKYCISPDHEIFHYVKNYYETIYFVPTMIDLSSYTANISKQNEKPLIVHAPTNPEIKGTAHVLRAIDKLQSEFQFDFRLVQNMSHSEAKKIYEQADLIIDQLHIGSYGLFAVEAMAMGKPVICYISDYMAAHYPKTLPLVSANPDTLTEKVRFLLQNQDCFAELGMKSRAYVKAQHDYIKNSQQLLEIYRTIIDSG